MSPPPEEVIAGQAVYNRLVLAGYDGFVLGFSCSLVWRCAKRHMLDNYQRNIGGRHVEFGTGTAYFLDRCGFPTVTPELTLVDLNPTVLRVSATRVARYQPAVVQADVLQPLPFDDDTLRTGHYDSVGANFLLHCLPGSWSDKAAVFDNAAAALRPGGRVFGSTILSSGVPVNVPARRLMKVYNARGIFHNADDDLAGLRWQLDQRFTDIQLTVRGCVALFEATKPALAETG
ncbi:class I SAM-dependent methyltransferase [Plantactinospora sp. KLBMP9567]|uniref:class I SAM-dependent methyltransferase n=1 Tax=Plantactinospora sp. KLBMP9567 TaxID=3085900 RepID=UPI002981C44F|nr:class I SAM-dependent methyltransferase [Plantactinospora sp. KLBMP9567]MDW5329723.1 class I SAM-dependent methyltransferase [Plantactinospora sp. KLBMP9567]